MKFVVGENGRNPVKNLLRPHFVHHETHMEGPRRELGTPAVGGERLTACAMRTPSRLKILLIFITIVIINYLILLIVISITSLSIKFSEVLTLDLSKSVWSYVWVIVIYV